MKNEQTNIEYQFLLYCNLVQLPIAKMGPTQLTETRRAFYAAWGQLLLYLHRDVVKMTHADSAIAMQDMFDQVEKFWEKEDLKQNGKS